MINIAPPPHYLLGVNQKATPHSHSRHMSSALVLPHSRAVDAKADAPPLHPAGKPGSWWRDLIPAFVLCCIVTASLAAAYLQPGGRQEQYLVVAPPGWSLGQTVNLMASADGSFVGRGRFSNMLFTTSNRADFPEALRAAGAWLVLPVPAQWGCGNRQERE